jgi:hypothetical protein
MAVAEFFPAFGYKWAQSGSTYNWDDAQYKQGWSTIGAVPPSVEQFNRVHQLVDEKANWLFGQLKAAADAKNITLTAQDLQGMRKILDAYAPTATTSVRGQVQLATSADVAAGNSTNAMTASLMGLIAPMRGIAVYQTAGTFTWAKPAGVSRVWVIVTGGGGAGGPGTGYNTDNSRRGGGGGAGGTYMRLVDVSGVNSVSVVVGAGGTQSSTSGKTSSFGAFCSATGGKPGATTTEASRVSGGEPGEGSGSGGIALTGGWGSEPTQVVSNYSFHGGSGDGGASFWGGGFRSGNGGAAGRGSVEAAPGSGGGGTDVNERGPGRPGIVVIQY